MKLGACLGKASTRHLMTIYRGHDEAENVPENEGVSLSRAGGEPEALQDVSGAGKLGECHAHTNRDGP